MSKSSENQTSYIGIWGGFLLLLGLSGIGALVLTIGENYFQQKGISIPLLWTIFWVIILFFLAVFVISILRLAWLHRKLQFSLKPARKSNKTLLSRLDSDLFSSVSVACRSTYGFFWKSKVNAVLLCAPAALAEQLAPSLTTQRWLEADGRLLLWGGESADNIDLEVLSALKKLRRRRPLDAVVWATDAYLQADSVEMKLQTDGLDDEQLTRFKRGMADCFKALRWSAPVYLWSLHGVAEKNDALVSCLLPNTVNSQQLEQRLNDLQPALIEQGTHAVLDSTQRTFLLGLAAFLRNGGAQQLSQQLPELGAGYPTLPFAGVLFSQGRARGRAKTAHMWLKDTRWDGFFSALQQLPQALQPQHLGWPWARTVQGALLGLAVLWGLGMLGSYAFNRHLLDNSAAQAALVHDGQQPLAQRLQALADLQQSIGRLQYQQEHSVPVWQRFGVSQHGQLLSALWPVYQASALPLLRDPSAEQLLEHVQQLAVAPVASAERKALAQPVYQSLKAYLMLSHVEKMEAEFFTDTLMTVWPQREGLSGGDWQRLGPELLLFYAEHLPQHTDWQLPLEAHWVGQTRAMLVREMGNRTSELVLYEEVIEQLTPQYADVWLSDMVGETDASFLLSTEQWIPGVYTRKAWEEAVLPAIEKVVNQRRSELDWVLSDGTQSLNPELTPEALKQRLTDRYFSAFANHWQKFLNSLQWRRADHLADTVEQLTLLTDVRQSPLIGLMNTLAYQAKTGRQQETLSDSLVSTAKDIFNKEQQPLIKQNLGYSGPLEPLFAPLLSVLEPSHTGAGAEHLSFTSYLTRASRVRLKLQQVLNAADPQGLSQALAQSVFQGRSSDLADTQDYARLVAASLGQELAAFGDAVWVQPLEQAWQQLLTPTVQSFNSQWQRAVVNDWQAAFAGRYPLQNNQSDSSLPLQAQYLRSDNGRINQFLSSQLQGVLRKEGTRWVADSNTAQGVRLNPEFLKALDTLGELGDVLFAGGDARLSFSLRPETSQDVMQVKLTIDQQTLDYRNEMPQWQHFTWPADTLAPGASLSWRSVDSGTRLYADFSGSWGLIRLLEQAEISDYPGLPSSYRLRWTTPSGETLSFILRTELGEGPLALLKLRGFNLPQQIFVD